MGIQIRIRESSWGQVNGQNIAWKHELFAVFKGCGKQEGFLNVCKYQSKHERKAKEAKGKEGRRGGGRRGAVGAMPGRLWPWPGADKAAASPRKARPLQSPPLLLG